MVPLQLRLQLQEYVFPLKVTAEVVPTLQRLVVGVEVKVPPSAVPHSPLIINFVLVHESLDPPQEPVQDQVKVVGFVLTPEAVPLLHKLVVGAVHDDPVSAEPQTPLTVGNFGAEQESFVVAVSPLHFS